MVYDKPIEVYKLADDCEKYTPWAVCPLLHARVNTARERDEYQEGQTTQHRSLLTFSVRYCSVLSEIFSLPQAFRVKYAGAFYDIVDTDDYMMEHRELRLKGMSIHGN